MPNSLMPHERLEPAFRYALSIPRVSIAVVGMAASEELRRNVAWAKSFQPLGAEERRALATVGKELTAKWGAHFRPVS